MKSSIIEVEVPEWWCLLNLKVSLSKQSCILQTHFEIFKLRPTDKMLKKIVFFSFVKNSNSELETGTFERKGIFKLLKSSKSWSPATDFGTSKARQKIPFEGNDEFKLDSTFMA